MSKAPKRTSRKSKLPNGQTKVKNESHAKGWFLEQLVNVLEKTLSNRDCTIKTRHRLRDRVTGELREADVYLEEPARGNPKNPKMTVIECRNHKAKVNSTYVEQIVTKRADLGSPDFWIVSKGGFTKGALAKAKHYTITTLTLDDIKDPLWISWLADAEFVESRPHYLFTEWNLFTDIELQSSLNEELSRSSPETLVLLDNNGVSKTTVKEALEESIPLLWNDAIDKLNRAGNHSIRLTEAFKQSRFIRVADGLVPIRRITVLCSFSWKEFPLEIEFSQYRLALGNQIRAELGHASLSDGTTVAFTNDLNGKRQLTLVPTSGGTFSAEVTVTKEGQIVEPPITKLDPPKPE